MNLKKIPSGPARGPYILLAIVTFVLSVYYLLAGIWTRVYEDLQFIVQAQFSNGIRVLYAFALAFQPGVVLYLAHQRGALLRASREITPFPSQIWKKIADWVLVAITFLISIASVLNSAFYYNARYNGSLQTSEDYVQANRGLSHAIVAISILLAINVVVSVIVLFVQGKQARWNDQVRNFTKKVDASA